MRKIPVLLMLAILCQHTHAQIGGTENWQVFTDTAGHFIARYPADWTNKIKEGNRVFFTSPSENAADNFFENVNISVTSNPAYGTTVKIKDLFPAVIEQIKPSFKDFTLESQRFFTWNNAEACEITYTGIVGSAVSKLRFNQWFSFHNRKLFTVTYTSRITDKTWSATARKIMSSISFR